MYGDKVDLKVSLAELEQYVQAMSRQNGVATPEPRLIPCGNSRQNLKDTIIVRLPKTAQPDGEHESAVSASSAGPETSAVGLDSSTQPSENRQPEEPASETKDVVAGTSKGTSEDEPTLKSDADKKLAPAIQDPKDNRSSVLHAWQLRDELEQRPRNDSRTGKPINPIDYAPLLWTKLNAELLAHHLKQLEQADTKTSVGNDISDISKGLDLLTNEPDGHRDGDLITKRIQMVLSLYRQSLTSDGDDWKSMPEKYRKEFLNYKTALLDFRYYFYRAAQYVRWHREAHCAANHVSEETTKNIEQLLELLKEFDVSYRELKGKELKSWKKAYDLLGRIEKVRKQARVLDEWVEQDIESICTLKGDPSRQRRLEIFLATDLITVDQRESLLDLLVQGANGHIANQLYKSNSEPDWETAFRLAGRHAGLECRLVKIVNPDLELEFVPFEDSLQTISSDKDRLAWFRDLGTKLHNFYNSEEENIHQEDAYVAEKMVVILHPRDTIGEDTLHYVKNRIGLPEHFTLTPLVQDTKLSLIEREEVAWKLSVVNSPVSSLEMRLDFRDELMVRYKGQPVIAEKSIKLPLSTDLLEFKVQAAREAMGSRTDRTRYIELSVFLDPPDRSRKRVATATARVVLPSPNRIDLIASCVDPQIEEKPIGKDGVRLQPFPNRVTEFQFELVNLSDTEKNLRVELFAVFRPRDAKWPPGRLLKNYDMPFDSLMTWAGDDRTIGLPFAKAELKLPADKRRKKIEFSPPGAGDRKAEPAIEDETAREKDKKKESVFKQVDITHGILCRLIDVSKNDGDDNKVLEKWIEIVPRRPNRYLYVEAELVKVGRTPEFRLSIQPKDLNKDGQPDLPSSIIEQPVKLDLRYKEIPELSPVSAEIKESSMTVPMSKSLDQNLQGTATLELTVDDFPRAFIWKVNMDLDDGSIKEVVDHSSVNIDWVIMEGDKNNDIPKRVYHRLHRGADIPESEAPGNSDQNTPIILVDRQTDLQASCAFNVKYGTRDRDLQIGLRVDAPPDAFHGVLDDVIKVQLGDKGESQSLYYDRQVLTEAVEITETGGLKIKSMVHDHMLSFNTPGVSDKKLMLTAEMRLEGKLIAEELSMQIVLDSRPPEVIDFEFPNEVSAGESIIIHPRIRDLSGISLIEVWVLLKKVEFGDLDKDAAQRFDGPFGLSDYGQWEPTLNLNAEEAGTYYTYLRVTDRSGQSSGKPGPRIEVIASGKNNIQSGPLVADLHGRVMLGNKDAPKGLTVYLKEKPQKKAQIEDTGVFVIKQVKVGNYTLIVEGTVTNVPVRGEQEVNLVKEEDFKGVVVPAKLDRSPPK